MQHGGLQWKKCEIKRQRRRRKGGMKIEMKDPCISSNDQNSCWRAQLEKKLLQSTVRRKINCEGEELYSHKGMQHILKFLFRAQDLCFQVLQFTEVSTAIKQHSILLSRITGISKTPGLYSARLDFDINLLGKKEYKMYSFLPNRFNAFFLDRSSLVSDLWTTAHTFDF